MIVEELRRFACAAQFLTRLPVPELRPWRDDRLARSARYFSLVGLLVGGICAAVLLMAREFWPSKHKRQGRRVTAPGPANEDRFKHKTARRSTARR